MATERSVGIAAVITQTPASSENIVAYRADSEDFYNQYKQLGGIFRESVVEAATTFLSGRNGHYLPNPVHESQAENAASQAGITLASDQKKLYSVLRTRNIFDVPAEEVKSVNDIPLKHSDQVIVAQVLLISGLISANLELYHSFRQKNPKIFNLQQAFQ